MTVDGLTAVKCAHPPAETINRLEKAIRSRGMRVFEHIDHAAGAKEAHLELRPTELLIFGSPKAGTPLMQMNQAVGFDLPLKALVLQDQGGSTYILYEDPDRLRQRHGLEAAAEPILRKMKEMLADLTHEAAGR